jgi:MoxR-like ATPase
MEKLSSNLNKIQYIKDDKDEFQPIQGGEWSEFVNQKIYPYYPSQALVEAVNLAIRLNRPLLLEGEPGCGKSQLAAAVAYQFSRRYPEIQWRYQLWNVQSTSKAQDGFYTYDYVGRLQAAQLGITDPESNPNNPENFINWGPLGYAFREHQCDETNPPIPIRTIVLIDEIDKADRDLPNDLLLAIEQQKFEVKEVRVKDEKGKQSSRWEMANPDAPPIIFITSNHEKDLPSAFLRRCFYHYVEFPKEEADLRKIINAHFEKRKEPSASIVTKAINKFHKLRERMEEVQGESGKKVSTSELIDWIYGLDEYPVKEIEKMLDDNSKELPIPGALLKNHSHYNEYK